MATRTINSSRNIFLGYISKIGTLIFSFVVRTVLLRVLGSDYVGLNSVFTSIIQVLNLADLGFSSAIVFAMYKPIHDNDVPMINGLLNFFSKVYKIIGTIILVAGLSTMPFLRYFLKGDYSISANIYVIYGLYVLNAVISYYLFGYKESVLIASQRNDLIEGIHFIVNAVISVLQIIVIFAFKNYYIFVILFVLRSVFSNIFVFWISKRKFPNYKPEGTIDRETKNNIKKQTIGLLATKLSFTTRNTLDSIFISSFISLSVATIYSNYFYVISTLAGLISVLLNAVRSSVGDSIVSESVDKNYKDFKSISFVYSLLLGWCVCCLLCLYQPFMKMWAGQELMFDNWTMVAFCLYFYIWQMFDIRNVYLEARGLWWHLTIRALIASALNVLFNIVSVLFFGVIGVVLGTALSILLTCAPIDTNVLYKRYFIGKSRKKYYLSLLIGFVFAFSIAVSVFLLLNYLLPSYSFETIVLRLALCSAIYIIIIIPISKIPLFKSHFAFLTRILSSIISKIRCLNLFSKNKVISFISQEKTQKVMFFGFCGILFILILIRDLNFININKIIFVVFSLFPAVLLNNKRFISFLFFLLPLSIGLPSGYILPFYVISISARYFKRINRITLLLPASIIVVESILCSFNGSINISSLLHYFCVAYLVAFFVFVVPKTNKLFDNILSFTIGSILCYLIIMANYINVAAWAISHKNESPDNYAYWLSLDRIIINVRFGYISYLKSYLVIQCHLEPNLPSMFCEDNPNNIAFFCIVCLVSLFVFEKTKKERIVFIALSIPLLFFGIWSGSRTFFVSLFAGFLVVLVQKIINTKDKFVPILTSVLVLSIATLSILIGAIYFAPIRALLMRFFGSDVLGNRDTIIIDYLSIWSKNIWHILFGMSVINLRTAAGLELSPHTNILQVLCSYGVVGTLVLVSIYVFLVIYKTKQLMKQKPLKNNFIMLLPIFITFLSTLTSQAIMPFQLMFPYLFVFSIINEEVISSQNTFIKFLMKEPFKKLLKTETQNDQLYYINI